MACTAKYLLFYVCTEPIDLENDRISRLQVRDACRMEDLSSQFGRKVRAQTLCRSHFFSEPKIIASTCRAKYPLVAANTWSLEALTKTAQKAEKPSVDA